MDKAGGEGYRHGAPYPNKPPIYGTEQHYTPPSSLWGEGRGEGWSSYNSYRIQVGAHSIQGGINNCYRFYPIDRPHFLSPFSWIVQCDGADGFKCSPRPVFLQMIPPLGLFDRIAFRGAISILLITIPVVIGRTPMRIAIIRVAAVSVVTRRIIPVAIAVVAVVPTMPIVSIMPMTLMGAAMTIAGLDDALAICRIGDTSKMVLSHMAFNASAHRVALGRKKWVPGEKSKKCRQQYTQKI